LALPPVAVRISADISELLAKVEAAKAAIDDFNAKVAESQVATKGEGLGGGFGGAASPMQQAGLVDQYGRPLAAARAPQEAERAIGGAGRPIERAAGDAERMNKGLQGMRQLLHGALQTGLEDMANNLKSIQQGLQDVANGLAGFGSGITSAFGTLTSTFTGPLSALGSLVGFAKTWAVMVPTLMAAPALLAAIGGVAGGLAGSFTVLSSVVGLFAMGAMKALSYVTSVSSMAQYDALSAPLQRLYMAYHNLSNEFTIMTQTMGQNTIVSVLTDMFSTMGTVLQRLGPLMGQAATAVQAAFNIISGSLLGSEFEHFVTWIGQEATPVLTTFATTFTNLASGWAGLMEALTPAITLFDDGMVKLTQTFSNWANSPKGQAQVEGFVSYVQKAWPEISKFWQGLGHIFYEFFHSAAAGAPAMAATLGHLFTVIGNAVPGLVKFADSVLPGIVNGFAQFGSGFFHGLIQTIGPLLDKLGGKGMNWTQVGQTVGKLAGDLLLVLPPLAQVLQGLINVALWVAKLPGGIWAIVGAWVAFKAVVIGGQIAGAFGGLGRALRGMASILRGMIGLAVQLATKMGLVTAATTSADVAGVGAGVAGGAAGGAGGLAGAGTALGAGFLGAVAGPLAGAIAVGIGPALVLSGSQAERNAQFGNYSRAMRSRSQGNPAFGARFGGGANPGNIQINAPTTITVQGHADSQTTQQIKDVIDQAHQKLVQRLVMTRGAYG
jgi:hypothetical protein